MRRYPSEGAAVVVPAMMLAGLLMSGCAWFQVGQSAEEPGMFSEQHEADSVSAEPPAASSASVEPIAQGRPAFTKPPAIPPATSGRSSTTGKIVGRVVRQDGSPLAYASIMVEGTGLGKMTDERGEFVIAGVPPGTRRVRLSMIGFADTVLDSVAVGADLNTTVGSLVMVDRQPPVMEEIVVTAERTRVIWYPEGTSRIISRGDLSVREDRIDEVVSSVAETSVCKPGADRAPDSTMPMLPPDEEKAQKAFQTAASPGGAEIETGAQSAPCGQARSTKRTGGEQ